MFTESDKKGLMLSLPIFILLSMEFVILFITGTDTQHRQILYLSISTILFVYSAYLIYKLAKIRENITDPRVDILLGIKLEVLLWAIPLIGLLLVRYYLSSLQMATGSQDILFSIFSITPIMFMYSLLLVSRIQRIYFKLEDD